MLIEQTLFGLEDKVKTAIELLRKNKPEDNYYFCNGGGKDSTVVRHLLQESVGLSGFDAHYHITNLDAPELVYFVREYHQETKFEVPKVSFWRALVNHATPPSRTIRWCCAEYKEIGGDNRVCVMGIRHSESNRRKKNWKQVGNYRRNNKVKLVVNPILYWSEDDVWEYIEQNNLPYCSLYDDPGYDRLGCILCTLSNKQKKKHEAERYPKYYQAYMRAFARMIENRKVKGLSEMWRNAEEVMEWFMEVSHKEIPMEAKWQDRKTS